MPLVGEEGELFAYTEDNSRFTMQFSTVEKDGKIKRDKEDGFLARPSM
jgi:hypothetical protein